MPLARGGTVWPRKTDAGNNHEILIIYSPFSPVWVIDVPQARPGTAGYSDSQSYECNCWGFVGFVPQPHPYASCGIGQHLHHRSRGPVLSLASPLRNPSAGEGSHPVHFVGWGGGGTLRLHHGVLQWCCWPPSLPSLLFLHDRLQTWHRGGNGAWHPPRRRALLCF